MNALSLAPRFRIAGVAALMLLAVFCRAAEVMPPAPRYYFNDFANVTRPATRDGVNRALEQFEKDTSSQIWVAVYPKMQSDSSIEDYTRRVAESWGVGRKDKNNGAVLFVFITDRKAYIQVGYGLEGAIPDAIAKRIIEEQLVPRFRAGDYDGGLSAAATSLMQAARGEYKGTGKTTYQEKRRGGSGRFAVFAIIAFFILISILRQKSRGSVYGRRGYSRWGAAPGIWYGGGGGGWGGGWSSGGGGGGFSSGGGGSFGGGGAGGSW
jgi:uncharacterized protein